VHILSATRASGEQWMSSGAGEGRSGGPRAACARTECARKSARGPPNPDPQKHIVKHTPLHQEPTQLLGHAQTKDQGRGPPTTSTSTEAGAVSACVLLRPGPTAGCAPEPIKTGGGGGCELKLNRVRRPCQVPAVPGAGAEPVRCELRVPAN
jgi:hypothetical protein